MEALVDSASKRGFGLAREGGEEFLLALVHESPGGPLLLKTFDEKGIVGGQIPTASKVVFEVSGSLYSGEVRGTEPKVFLGRMVRWARESELFDPLSPAPERAPVERVEDIWAREWERKQAREDENVVVLDLPEEWIW